MGWKLTFLLSLTTFHHFYEKQNKTKHCVFALNAQCGGHICSLDPGSVSESVFMIAEFSACYNSILCAPLINFLNSLQKPYKVGVLPRFRDEETEACRCWVTCPRPYSWLTVELVFEHERILLTIALYYHSYWWTIEIWVQCINEFLCWVPWLLLGLALIQHFY